MDPEPESSTNHSINVVSTFFEDAQIENILDYVYEEEQIGFGECLLPFNTESVSFCLVSRNKGQTIIFPVCFMCAKLTVLA
jgi:hypothetical protein